MKHNWEYKPIEDCFAYIKNGATIKQEKGAVGFPITRIETLSNGVFNRSKMGYANILELGKYAPNVLNDGDLLMSHINSKTYLGRTVLYEALPNEVIIHGMNLLRLIPNETTLSKFFYYITLSHYFKSKIVNIRKDAVNQSSFSITDLKKIHIPVPPMEVQQQIVAELDKINEVIEECRELLRTLDSLAQSIFYDTFGDPISNPKGWPIRQISEIGEIERGTGISKKDFVANGSPCIHYGQLHTAFGPTAHKHLTCIPKNLLSKPKIAHPRDVIMAITSEDVEGSCKSTAWLGDYDIIVGSDAAILHHNQNGVYISYYTLTSAFSHEKAKYAKGFKVTHISSKEIGSIPIMVPPLSLQQQFAAQIEAIEAQKNAVEATISEMKTLLDSRMDYWFND